MTKMKACKIFLVLTIISDAARSSRTLASEVGQKTRSLRRNRNLIHVDATDPSVSSPQEQFHPQERRKRSNIGFDSSELRLLEETLFEDEIFRFLEVSASLSLSMSMSMAIPVPTPPTPPTPTPPTMTTPAPTVAAALVGESDPPVESVIVLPETEPPQTDPPATDAPETSFSIAPETVSPTSPPPTGVPATPGPTPAATTPVPANIQARSPRDLLIEEKCGVTELERSRDILTLLMTVSEGIMLVSPDTSQYQARMWIDEVDEGIICADNVERLVQRYRASLFYYQMNGPLWSNCRAMADSDGSDDCLTVAEEGTFGEDLTVRRVLEGSAQRKLNNRIRRRLQGQEVTVPGVRFLDASHECEWFGLSCGSAFDSKYSSRAGGDGYYPIIEISLPDNGLAGELFDELYGFTNLVGLYLDGNRRITGRISPMLGDLEYLEYLDLDENSLSGELPAVIYTMSNLIAIDLNDNNMVGELTDDIANLSNLSVLQLENNAFSGLVPLD